MAPCRRAPRRRCPLLTSPPPAPATFWGHFGCPGGPVVAEEGTPCSGRQSTPLDPVAQTPVGGQPSTPKPSPRFGPTVLSLPPGPTRSPFWFPTELLAQHAAFGVPTAPGAGVRGVPYTPGDPHPLVPPRHLPSAGGARAPGDHPSCRNGAFISHELEQVWIKITRWPRSLFSCHGRRRARTTPSLDPGLLTGPSVPQGPPTPLHLPVLASPKPG